MNKPFLSLVFVISFLSFGCTQPIENSETSVSSDDSAEIVPKVPQDEAKLAIAEGVFQNYLDQYVSSTVDTRKELKDYEINTIELKSVADSEFTFFVDYSVQTPVSVTGTEALTDWVAGNGKLDADGWIRNKVVEVTVTKQGEDYVITNMGLD